jgi:hypothetical protein
LSLLVPTISSSVFDVLAPLVLALLVLVLGLVPVLGLLLVLLLQALAAASASMVTPLTTVAVLRDIHSS